MVILHSLASDYFSNKHVAQFWSVRYQCKSTGRILGKFSSKRTGRKETPLLPPAYSSSIGAFLKMCCLELLTTKTEKNNEDENRRDRWLTTKITNL